MAEADTQMPFVEPPKTAEKRKEPEPIEEQVIEERTPVHGLFFIYGILSESVGIKLVFKVFIDI